MTPLEVWRDRVAGIREPDVLATGTKPWTGSAPEDHSVHAPHGKWLGTDIDGGVGVDIVGDLQQLHEITDKRFDAVFSPSTLEHIERPWTAMYAMSQLLKPGGLLFVQTHHTFPLHGYPHDYFRFSKEALETMAWDAGLHTLASGYEFPCSIRPPASVTRWNTAAPAFLNVCICAEKSQ